MEQDAKNKPESTKEYSLREEMNFSDFPIARLGARDKRTAIVHEEWVGKAPERHYQKWIAYASSALGLPTELAERVLVTLITIAHEQEFAKQTVFTVYRICKILGLAINKNSYTAVENALYQLAGLTIISEEAFYSKREKKRITTKTAFHIIEIVWLRHVTDDLVPELPGENGYVVWNDVILSSMKAGYIKKLDGTVYFRLSSPLARTMYKMLDKQMHYRNSWEIDIFILASRLGMVKYKYPSKVIEKLQPAFDELIQDGFLESAEVVKRGKYTRVVFTKAVVSGWSEAEEPFPFEGDDDTDTSDTSASDASETTQTGETVSGVIIEQKDPWRALYEAYGTSEEHLSIWAQVLKALSASMPRSIFEQYIEHTQLLAIESNEAVVGVLYAESKDWLERQLGKRMLKTLNGQLSEKVGAIRFVSLKELSSM